MSAPSDGRPAGLHLAVALDGAGWHPAAWREPGARAGEVFTAGYWADLVAEADRGLLDLVTLEDGLALQTDVPGAGAPTEDDVRTDRVRGRLDAVLLAQRLAPVAFHVGIVPTVVATHSEPFHVSTQVATLDWVSSGRAGVRVRVSTRPDEAAAVGWREPPAGDALFDEASDHVEVLRRLWDSWEDDAEIRDAASGRFVDRAKLHYVDFAGPWFAVRGPSITPRPPQGQPLVTALAHVARAYRFAARSADVVFVTPGDADDAARILDEVHAHEASDRSVPLAPLRVLGDLVVALDDDTAGARARLDRLDAAAGTPMASDARILAGSAVDVADVLEAWRDAGYDGARLRPAVHTHDLPRIARDLVPELQRRGLFRTAPAPGTLRDRFGLARPADRYAPADRPVTG